MKITVVLYMVLISAVGFSQMLDNSNGFAFTDQPFFNPTFIKANKIDKVRGIVITNRPDSKNAQYQSTIKQGDILLNRVQKLSRVINI